MRAIIELKGGWNFEIRNDLPEMEIGDCFLLLLEVWESFYPS